MSLRIILEGFKLKGIKYNKHFLILLGTFLMLAQCVLADVFQNNLLKVDLYESSLGGVKMTLYTNKPYQDSVRVNKKSDYEYVIFMPETSNSLTAKPSLKSVSNSVKDIEVKTQQYSSQIRGYTKIVVTTTKPVEITPQVEVLSAPEYKLSEKDYNELLAQKAVKKQTATIQKPAATVKKEVKPVAAAKKAPVVQAQKKETKVLSAKPIVSAVAQKPVQKVVQTAKKEVKPTVAVKKQPAVQEKPAQKVIQKPVATRPVEKIEPKQQVKPAVKPQPTKEVVKEETSTETPSTIPAQEVSQQPQTAVVPVEQPKIQENIPVPVMPKPMSITDKISNRFQIIIAGNGLAGTSNYTLLLFALIPLILLLLLFRILGKTAQKLKKQKSEFVANLKEKPVKVTNYNEKIHKDMNWKEKFQAYVDASKQQVEAQPKDESTAVLSDEMEELDSLFADEAFPRTEVPQQLGQIESGEGNVEELAEEAPEEIQIRPSVVTQSASTLDEFSDVMEQEAKDDISVEELFSDEEVAEEQEIPAFVDNTSFEEEYYKQEEEESAEEIIKDEYVIDATKGFYLVDFEDSTALVGHIEDEIFVLKKFDSKVDAPLQARLDERRENSANFMTKVGTFKGVVEVTPQNMNLLIEL